jgi:hypothetical protein
MARTISCDAFTGFYLLYVALFFVAVLSSRGNGRSSPGVVGQSVDHLVARPDRMADRVSFRLSETGPGWGRTPIRESDIPGLKQYAQRFEDAIEKIRLRHRDFEQRT